MRSSAHCLMPRVCATEEADEQVCSTPFDRARSMHASATWMRMGPSLSSAS